MNKIIWLVFLIYAFAKAEVVYAQKVESEYRIDASQVPASALEFITDFKVKNKIKWIQEVSASGSSIEAKFKSHGARYSIEFNANGELEDVEVVVSFASLDKKTKAAIKDYLKSNFDYYKIEKVQAQYIETPERMLQWRRKDQKERVLQPTFEIVIKSRNSDESAKRFEFLFDEQGAFLLKEQIVKRSDNILRF